MQQSAGAMDEAFRVGVEQGRRFKGLRERQAEGMVGRLRCRWAGFSSTEKLDEKKAWECDDFAPFIGTPKFCELSQCQ